MHLRVILPAPTVRRVNSSSWRSVLLILSASCRFTFFVFAVQGDGSFAIHQSGEPGRVHGQEGVVYIHINRPAKRKGFWQEYQNPFTLVEAAGQLVLDFHPGLDYSFTCGSPQGRACCGRMSTLVLHGLEATGAYESLAGLRVSPSPDGVGMGRLPFSVHRMSPLFPTGITPRGDHCVNRTRVRKSSALGSTCLSTPIDLTSGYPAGGENHWRVRQGFNAAAPDELWRDPVWDDPRDPVRTGTPPVGGHQAGF